MNGRGWNLCVYSGICLFFLSLLPGSFAGDVGATILVVSLEGKATCLNLEDEFMVDLDSTSVGKKIEEKSILVTGKNGSVGLLFSNGTLVTVKPGTRFYLREYSQKIFDPSGLPLPSKLEEEPSQSRLLAHLDFGELVVKVPKLRKGSNMILSSPLGTAGIRGTMFQFMAVRNPVTGDITGGVNLISGDVAFTDLNGDAQTMMSGQSVHVASSRLGLARAVKKGALFDLNSVYRTALIDGNVPPTVDQLFPDLSSDSESGDFSPDPFSMLTPGSRGDWEVVHKVASDIFFDIEKIESQAEGFDFESMQYAVTVSTPSPQIESPTPPASVTGGIFPIPEPVDVLFLNPPSLDIHPASGKLSQDAELIEYMVQRKHSDYPVADDGPFKILASSSDKYPSYSSADYNGADLSGKVKVYNANSVDYSILGQETQLTLYVDDLEIRKLSYPSGKPVSTTLTPTVRIVDNLSPLVLFSDGETEGNPYLVEGGLGRVFVDPGITLVDNYYAQQEIVSHMGYSAGPEESVFGKVDMEVAGLYQLTYQQTSDPSGNVIEPKSRWIRVFDNDAPIITLYGSDPIYVDLNSTNVFKDPGAFASDNLDGAIEWEDGRFEVTVEVLADSGSQSYNAITTTFDEVIAVAKSQASVNATFRFKYLLKDRAGNQSEVFRQVVLLNSPFDTPTMIMHGDNPLYHEVNTDFVDPGVTAYKDLGTGVAPINLNDKVSAVAYSAADASVASVIDSSVVNYDMQNGKHVDASGNEDPTTRVIIRYLVLDQFGNQTTLDREVRIVDTTPPVITLNDDGGINFLNLKTGHPFIDPGAVASDNYDSSPTVVKSIQSIANGQVLSDPAGGEIFQTLENRGFWEAGSYKVSYQSTDSNGNTGTKERNLVVQDTLPPDMVAITHQFLANPSISLTSYQDATKTIIGPTSPLPTLISTSLNQLSGYDNALLTFNRSTPYVNDFASSGDLYFKYSQIDVPSGGFDDTGTGQTTVQAQDTWGRVYVWHSAFKVQLTSGVTVQDPGVFVLNDSTMPVTVTSSISKTFDGGGNPYKYYVSYTATQSSGETSSIPNARVIRFLDEEAPTLDLSPVTDGLNIFVLAEGGEDYTDIASDVYTWVNAKGASEALITSAYDVIDEGAVSNKINRTIFPGIVNASNWVPAVGTVVLGVDPTTNVAKPLEDIGNAVKGEIPTNLASLNQIYTIKYDVTDSAGNAATPAFRYVMVRDTLPPVIGLPPTQLVIVDSTSISNPDVRDEQSIKDYLVSDLTVQDGNNNFDTNLDWNVTIKKPNGQNSGPGGTGYDAPSLGAASGIVFPIIRTDKGYEVTITASDSSGNVSAPVTRELQIGDNLPPTLTMMGNSIIHDFLRFKENTTANTTQLGNVSGTVAAKNAPFLDRPFDSSTNPEYNATGFGGGAHRMMLASYDFVDPGVYGEDGNVNWSIDSGFPDWDGDGLGEGYEFVKVTDRSQMDTCTYQGTPTYLKIHVYSQLNTKSLEQWQNDLSGGTIAPGDGFGSPSSAKTPETDGADPSGFAFTDLNKTDPSRLRNLNVTQLTIEYRVMDGWGNLSNISTRIVYIYESYQYDQYAFYATPINGLEQDPSGEMAAYYNDGNSTAYLTSIRKDTDGDGMSDYWEAIFETDPKVPDASHATPDWSSLNGVDSAVIQTRVQSTLLDASQLYDMNKNWISSSHMLYGL
ncbi:MAG: hypothetical protein HN531_10520 [Opitutae bacterium]|nr:hypothetical protein [Opitutae bacterium]